MNLQELRDKKLFLTPEVHESLVTILCFYLRKEDAVKMRKLLTSRFYSLEPATYWKSFEVREGSGKVVCKSSLNLAKVRKNILSQYDKLIRGE